MVLIIVIFVVGTEKNRLNETVLLSTPLPPFFLFSQIYFFHVPVVSMLLSTFAMLN